MNIARFALHSGQNVVLLTSIKKPRTANPVLSSAARAAAKLPLYFEWTFTMCS